MHNDKLAGIEKCDVCGKGFMEKLHLKKHRRQGCMLFCSVLALEVMFHVEIDQMLGLDSLFCI